MPAESSSAPNVLWVEDQVYTLTFVETLLRERGVAVKWSATISEATDALEKEDYDLIVLDCMLAPGKSDEKPIEAGVNFLQRIRDGKIPSRAFDRAIPVLVLTGVANRDILEALSKLGATQVITKPAFSEKICDAICQILWTKNDKIETA
jgi:CheY-like chemotaxis protein